MHSMLGIRWQHRLGRVFGGYLWLCVQTVDYTLVRRLSQGRVLPLRIIVEPGGPFPTHL